MEIIYIYNHDLGVCVDVDWMVVQIASMIVILAGERGFVFFFFFWLFKFGTGEGAGSSRKKNLEVFFFFF